MITTLAIGKEGLHPLSELGMAGHGLVTRLGNEGVVVTVTDVEEEHLPSQRILTMDGVESVPRRRVDTDKDNDSASIDPSDCFLERFLDTCMLPYTVCISSRRNVLPDSIITRYVD
jgi:hypothetical protein